jgi:hypothetical protein
MDQLVGPPQVTLSFLDLAALKPPLGGQPHRPGEGPAFVVAHGVRLDGLEGLGKRLNHDHGVSPQRQEGDFVWGELFPLPGALHLKQAQALRLAAVSDEQVGAAFAHVAEIQDAVAVGAQTVADVAVVRVSAAVLHMDIVGMTARRLSILGEIGRRRLISAVLSLPVRRGRRTIAMTRRQDTRRSSFEHGSLPRTPMVRSSKGKRGHAKRVPIVVFSLR